MTNLKNMIDNLEEEFDVTWNTLTLPKEVKKSDYKTKYNKFDALFLSVDCGIDQLKKSEVWELPTKELDVLFAYLEKFELAIKFVKNIIDNNNLKDVKLTDIDKHQTVCNVLFKGVLKELEKKLENKRELEKEKN